MSRINERLGEIVETFELLGDPSDVWGWLMQRIASRPEHYYYTADGENLAGIYEDVLVDIQCGR